MDTTATNTLGSN